MTNSPHFGVMVPQIKRTWQETRRASLAFEEMGFDSLWVNDHLYGPQSPAIPMLEAWTLAAGIAAATETSEIGTLVTPVGMRNPAHTGKMIATVDNIAGGRVIPGFGSGWMPREFTDFGMPFVSTRDRLRQLEEGLQIFKGMFDADQDEFSFEGEFFHTENLVTQPKPPRDMPILVGGGGEKVTMRIAAQYADIWNNSAGSQDDLEHKVSVLHGHANALGRDPSELCVSQQCLVTIVEDDAKVGPMVERAQKIFGGHMGNPAGDMALTGTPSMIKERIEKHVELGCDMFMIEFFGRDTIEPAQMFAETVIPEFR